MNALTRLCRAIAEAGGQSAVARACRRSQPTVFEWTKRGLPQTEYLPDGHPRRTRYAEEIAKLAGDEYTADELLGLAPRSTEEDAPRAEASA